MKKLTSSEEIARLDAMIMPFGKFKGRKMAEVPASYLDWLRGGDLSRQPQVAEYIEKMGDYIDGELEDE